jgi:hypothetical protein
MSELEYPSLKKTIIEFAVRGVQNFLQEHPSLLFYAVAFDCNAEYAEINLCLNTEENFAKVLNDYQTNYPQKYQNEEDIRGLRYNTGDWAYQCFDTIYVLTDEQLNSIFQAMPDDDYQTWQTFVGDLLILFTEALRDFTQTEAYKSIPKTKDFIAFCIDHDEEVEDALNRMKSCI